ncbi:AAA family ATPase [Massilia aurea]|uniref:AAA family ATPase n=1 Tax=Massilia aurea TaxID=373040 RepID=UPI0034622F5E
MLERIQRVQGIGLLHDVNAKPHQLQKATLIYADNGRGKSTLAAILRSASTGLPEPIEERRTVDGTLPPSVLLDFSNGVKAEYATKKWTKACPEVLIFDGGFIEENVCSGGAVGPGHRKNLLQFALGAAAVDARKKEEHATAETVKATEACRQVTAQLAGYHGSLALSAFEKLVLPADADAQIAALQKRLAVATGAAEVLKRPIPREIELPRFDSNALFGILQTTLEDIQNDAELLVRNHIASVPILGIEGWISSGQIFDDGRNCPYCAQNTTGLGLLHAYKTHFNTAYSSLKSKVAQLNRGLEVRLGPQIIATFIDRLDTVVAQRETWVQDIDLVLPEFDKATAEDLLTALNHLLTKLIQAKEVDPTSKVGEAGDIFQTEQLWAALVCLMESTNEQIRRCGSAIELFKKGLAQEQPASVQVKINTLIAAKRRAEPVVVALLTSLKASKVTEATCQAAKKKAREELDAIMSTTLGVYEKSINVLLQKFGATFRIEKMDANFRGGAPRTDYGIKMRGKSVVLDGGVPRFATALSDGDKRTLAFAFFVASSAADPKIQSRIIVIDDPMCSLDANRKHHTKTVLRSLHAKADQLILLAHDPFFIRDLRDELLSKDGQSQVQILQLCHAENGYTKISKFDVSQACESKYYRNHRMLKEFCSGTRQEERNVAMALRPFLEGYIHRRFPLLVPEEVMFGSAIGIIKAAQSPSPLAFAHALVDELSELNAYASQFHHDTNQGNADGVPVIAEELRAHCERALHLAYSGQARA